jgi:hypothetical protein
MSSENCRFIAMGEIGDSGAFSELHALFATSRDALLATGRLPADPKSKHSIRVTIERARSELSGDWRENRNAENNENR